MAFKTIIKWVFNVGFSGLLITPSSHLLSLIPWEKYVELANYQWLVTPILHISLLQVFLFFILLAIFIAITSRINSILRKRTEAQIELEREQSYQLRVAQLKSFRSMRFENNNTVEVRWDICEPSFGNTHYHADNIEYYCMLHNPPLLMPYGHCNRPDCPNAQFSANKSMVRNEIDSRIIQMAKNLGLEQ